ncbi:COesterase and/or Abhydrolase 3 domain containing protein [Asbolus verrucosus]|uniref:COesterase and/or Abhydrolase 3 domain containing protein n=1 Tax=Asbolus verrucosus TaxID=1661398 RepID=A0A482W6X5_ASBVE|nr:COesterase and/or Abhydrolase 3 domain containing protein [Asbolus verrucosus]
MQYNQYTPPEQDFVIGDEDCLYLNIYTPTVDQNAKLDVIVYIHGGAFIGSKITLNILEEILILLRSWGCLLEVLASMSIISLQNLKGCSIEDSLKVARFYVLGSEGLYPAADFYIDEQYLTDIDTRWNELIPLILDYNYTVDAKLHDEVSQKVRKHYLGNKRVSRQTFKDFIPIVSDRIFVIHMQKAARLQATATKSPVYSYYFTYRGAHSWSEYRGGSTEDFGASHGDDTCYVYKIGAVNTTTTEDDRKMIDVFVKLVTTFAKTGRPKVSAEWPRVPKSPKKPFTYLRIDSPTSFTVETGISENTEFWNSLPIKENKIVLSMTFGETPPEVNLPNLGKIQGSFGKSLNGRSFFSFEGVPYAHPPVGKYRFKEPEPVKPWNGVLKAKTIYKCMQYNQYTPPGQDFVIGDEDCLYLNIYTPTVDQNAKLDVIVYIHGGAFMFNWGGLQGPEYILDKDVVFININYRLGPLGFLSTEDKVVPGNNGMKDQIFALKWVQEHVKHFGGNPDSVTIMGMSAGGASVHFHYLSPKSSGLFHKGISQSGSTLCPWVLVEKPLEKTMKLAAGLGCPTKDVNKMIECLKKRPGRQIVASVKDFQPWLYIPFSPFGLVVDSWSADPVLPDHPYLLLKNKKVYDIPWIASYTNSEGLYPAADFYIDEKYLIDVNTRWNELLPFILDYNYTVDVHLHNKISQKIRKHYLGDKSVSRTTFMDFIPIVSDRIFLNDIQKAARLQASATTSPIYSYYFTYRGAHSWSEYRGGSAEDFGASHGDDTCYAYKIEAVDTTTTEDDRKMIDVFVEMITSFAKTGKPKVPVEWPQVPKNDKEPFTYLRIDSPTEFSVGTGVSENVKLENLGKIQGGFGKSLNGRRFFSFEGVPYAHPPTGKYRFKEPAPVKPWKGVWMAKTIYKCMQHNQYTPLGQDSIIGKTPLHYTNRDEDCLYLNIYTPTLDQNAKLDVIVYIHGGVFMFNWGGLHGPKYLLDKDVVVINLNYRLGPLGFLSTEDDVVPGNNGMRDQIFALQWIKEHIKYFGGNPDSVTIIGMSAGGASVQFHYLSPKSRGLFHKGISQSGSMLNPWVLVEKPLDKAQKLARDLGCSTKDINKMIECLKTKPGRQIVASVKDFQPFLYVPISLFGPVVDSWASDPVLPEHPYLILKKKKVYDIPWIASYTSSEGLYPAADFYFDEQYLTELDNRWNELIPLLLDYKYTVDPELQDAVSQKIRKHYMGDKKLSRSTYMDFIPMVSDRTFVIEIQKGALLQAAAIKSPTYSYYFTYRGAHSWSESRTGFPNNFGASHGDDTSYVFNIDAVDTTTTEEDRKMIDVFVEMVTSFAKTGKPKVPVEWPQIPKNLNSPYTYLKIDSPLKFSIETGVSQNAKFWDSLPMKESEKLFPDEPSPVKPWVGVWEAKTIYKCMQYNEYTLPGDDYVIGDEDCLYLNIYTPTLDKTAKLDVIVYIHGGAFMFLYAGFYGPDYIMDRDVVYVNLNYRLGPLGFLSTQDHAVPGNNGIKDQIVALRWIKDHIKQFGGNPDSITITGMSAGGASVHLHYLTPKSRGLFHRGISQSGTTLNPWVLMENPLEKSQKLAATLGCPTEEVMGMVECLKRRPGRQIVNSVKEFQPWLYNPFSPFGVVVDSWASDPVLPEHPLKLIENKQVADLPWITTETNFEGLYPASDFLIDEQRSLKDIDTRWNELMPFILDYNYTVDVKLHDEVSQKIRKHYLGEKKVDRKSFVDFVHIISDRMFVVDIEKTAKLQASAVTSPIYFYYYTYRGARAWYESSIGHHEDFGAAHAEDTYYIFKSPVLNTYSTESDKLMVQFFLDMFTSFAKTGKPNVSIPWTPVSKNMKDPLNSLKIGSPTKVEMHTKWPENEEFWASLPIKENEKLIVGIKDEL